MGGEVNTVVHVTAGKGSCDFVSYANDGSNGPTPGDSLHLMIAVGLSSPKECVTGERLTGIGEDSVLCSAAVGGAQQEIIRGRVRGTYFLLVLRAAKATPSDKALHRTMLEHIAEVVAGNLF
jgi:hypothetical protein